MAEKRMFSKEIVDSDAFLDMPSSTQNLYFHLGMRADDDGFINSPNKIMSICKASKNDMDLLILKNFIIPFQTGILVIKHWRLNNYLRQDRYKPTNYQEEYSKLNIKENGAYQLENGFGIPMVDQPETQNRLEKISIDKKREEERKPSSTPYKVDSVLIRLLDISDLDEEVKSAVNSWLEYKYQRKEKYVEDGFKSLLTVIKKKCATYGNEKIINLIMECKSNCYKGIIWDKLPKIETDKPSKVAAPKKYLREE